jgi:hypothetical protein
LALAQTVNGGRRSAILVRLARLASNTTRRIWSITLVATMFQHPL